MTTPHRSPKIASLAGLSQTETRVLVVTVVLVLAGLTALLVGRSWQAGSDAPHWVSTETLRAPSNGESIRARLALDVPDPDTRAWLSSRPRQVSLLLQISMAEQAPDGSAGSARVQRLAEHIETRLNEMLEASDVPPVRAVVIQDLVISKI